MIAAVVAWLSANGIDKSRLVGVGYGMDRPMVSNDTEEGRSQNRRLEFHIETGDTE